MNSVLSMLTWGTWDEADWVTLSAATTICVTSAGQLPTISQRERSRRKLYKKGLKAPRNSQLWFEELLERVEGTTFGRSKLRYYCNPINISCKSSQAKETQQQIIPWADLPRGIHPRDGKLPPERVTKKRQQVDNLAVFLQRILRPDDVVVEFCAGSGYVVLPLAFLFPQCKFILLDKKKPSLAIAKERIAAAQLTNVDVFCGFVDDYHSHFNVGVALHACGEATDMVMRKCLAERAAYVLAPCCVGKIKSSGLTYPRSVTLANEVSRVEYEVLAKAADFGHSINTEVAHADINRRRRRCKTLLESDRNMYAEEAQYITFMFVMYPSTATPKNDVLVGIPRNPAVEATEQRNADVMFHLMCKSPL